MLVSQILKHKKNQGIVTIAPDTGLAQAVGEMSAKRIGCVVVSSDGETLEGILSERDILMDLARRGATCLEGKVADVMTRNVETCARDDRADDILARMTEGRFRHLPVVEDGKMVGLISIGDVVKARLDELTMEKDALEGMIMGH